MKDPRVAVAQIPDCIQRIRRYTAGGREVFFHDSLVQDAVIRNFEVIGEAAKRIPDDYRLAHSHLPWREMAGFRDVLIHQCEGVSLPEVWRVVEADLPRIEPQLANLVPARDILERELSQGDVQP